MATTAAANNTAPTISFDEASDEAQRNKPHIMLGRDRPLDVPPPATSGLFGKPLDFSVSIAVIEPYNSHGAITAGDNLILVNRGASEHYLDGYTTPGLRGRLPNYKTLVVPRKITTAGNHELEGGATGVSSGTVIDTLGQRQSAGLTIVVISGLRKKSVLGPGGSIRGHSHRLRTG